MVGTAVGLVAAVAFANQDDEITRRELASDRGVVAMFLRPLTIKRGVDQIFRLQFPVKRTLLVILTVTTALMSAATVALFGIREVTEELVNPGASFPLASLNGTFFTQDRDGGLFATASPTQIPLSSQLSGFLYKAAYITGLKMMNKYNPRNPYIPFLPEQGPVGDTLYKTLNTGGVGLNMSSYLQYSGRPTHFNMPARFEFNKLRAIVYGTYVNVSCQNVTSEYSVSEADIDVPGLDVFVVGKPGVSNLTFFSDSGLNSYLAIGSAVTVNGNGVPIHTLAIPSSRTALVLECTYSGQEYLAEVSVNSSISALHIDREVLLGPVFGPYVAQRLANLTHRLLAFSNSGGNLAQGFIAAEYNEYGYNDTDMATALETVIGQLGEAYFSVLRQHVERSNLDSDLSQQGASELRMSVTIQRLGGAQFGWLAILGVLLIGSLMGLVQSCLGNFAVDFDAQDAVNLLRSTLKSRDICDTTRVQHRDGIVKQGMGDVTQVQSMEREVIHPDISKREVR